MADTLQEKYYGMLSNMPAECGTIGVVVDTTAKTVTTLLSNPDSGYSVAGGVEYVIPEQTVTITQNPASITINDISGIQAEDEVIMKISKNGSDILNFWTLQMTGDGYLSGVFVAETTIYGVDVTPSGSSADLYIYDASTDEDAPGTYTISAVTAF